MTEKKELLTLFDAAKRLRDLTIERNIVHLKSQIAQTEASDLHNRARKLDHEVMMASGDLSRTAIEGIPEMYNVSYGGDNESAKQMIAKLVLLREERRRESSIIVVDDPIPLDLALDKAVGETFNTSVGFFGHKESDEYMAKLFAKRYDERSLDEETKMLTEHALDKVEALEVIEEDTSPWDSTIE